YQDEAVSPSCNIIVTQAPFTHGPQRRLWQAPPDNSALGTNAATKLTGPHSCGRRAFPRNMRPIWKGSISFGLVYIPVAVYPATREEKISFRQLRSSDLSPIKYKKVAEADSKEVPADQIVKGFEFEKGRY